MAEYFTLHIVIFKVKKVKLEEMTEEDPLLVSNATELLEEDYSEVKPVLETLPKIEDELISIKEECIEANF